MISLFNFLKRIYSYRSMIWAMTIQEIQRRYAGTLAGFVWSVINPLMMILIYWFVFSVGFRVKPSGDIPFIVIFCCGFIPWIMFSESLMNSTHSIKANVHLVKKMVFPTEILPVVNLMASLITHSFMLIMLIVLLLLNNITLSFYNFQFIYYFLALSVFTLGLSWFFSAVNVFYSDIGQALSVILNMWFWLTPIVWITDIIPQKYQLIIKLNPMYYIVDGYRASFAYHNPFWYNYKLGIYFWVICLLTLIIGGLIFRKLKPEFADIL